MPKKESFVNISGNYPYQSVDLFPVDADVSISVGEEERTVVVISGPKSMVKAINIGLNGDGLVIQSNGKECLDDVYALSPADVKYTRPVLQIRLGKEVVHLKIKQPKGSLRLHFNNHCGLMVCISE